MNLIDTNSCTFCGTHEETLLHLFYDCEYITPLMNKITTILKNLDRNLQINSRIFLLGTYKPNFLLDSLLLEVKKYVYFCRNESYKPSLIGMKNFLTTAANIHCNTKTTWHGNYNMTIVEHIIGRLP